MLKMKLKYYLLLTRKCETRRKSEDQLLVKNELALDDIGNFQHQQIYKMLELGDALSGKYAMEKAKGLT